MPDNDLKGLTEILVAAGKGDPDAVGQLYTLLYHELHEQAHRRVRRMANGSSLDTTSLVHESYLRMANAGSVKIENRGHFLAYAAHVMRSVVVDFVRHARAQKSGGNELHVTLNSNLVDSSAADGDEVIRLSEFLDELAAIDQRLVSVVEMRYFGALENREIAECLGIADRTVRRDLEKIRLLLIDVHR
jgi:RNA polymerase sigma factor (TIGR02999 family)